MVVGNEVTISYALRVGRYPVVGSQPDAMGEEGLPKKPKPPVMRGICRRRHDDLECGVASKSIYV